MSSRAIPITQKDVQTFRIVCISSVWSCHSEEAPTKHSQLVNITGESNPTSPKPLWLHEHLRSSAPKKRPMIFRQKIKSADFYFSSRSSQILFQNVFILIQFCFFPKISTHDVVWSVGTQITPKISPFEITSEIIIATQNNEKNYTGIKKRAF